MMSCSVAARSGSAADAGSWSALDITIVRILTIVAAPVNCRHAVEAAWFLWRNVRSRAAVVRSKQDLLAEDKRLNVHAGELEVRPPGAPSMENLGAARLRD